MILQSIVDSISKEINKETPTHEDILDFFNKKEGDDDYVIEIIVNTLSKYDKLQMDPKEAKQYVIQYVVDHIKDLCGW